jgi:hypothetical protein
MKPDIKRGTYKIHQIKQSVKIQQAASYQAPNSLTLFKSEKKRVAEDDDVSIDEEKTTLLKKPKYHCEYCDITFNSSNSLCQHRHTQKHKKNQLVILIISFFFILADFFY